MDVKLSNADDSLLYEVINKPQSVSENAHVGVGAVNNEGDA